MERVKPSDIGANLTAVSHIDAIASRVRASLHGSRLRVVGEDLARPWGGFLVVAQGDLQRFVSAHFANADIPSDPATSAAMSPKVLLVAPGMRLSWQYHLRRSEVWRILEGPVGVSHGFADDEAPMHTFGAGDLLQLGVGERHRLAGLGTWGVVAEIWVHADPLSPSDERDIVRLTDDHQRAEKRDGVAPAPPSLGPE